jgi:hypothetical protein
MVCFERLFDFKMREENLAAARIFAEDVVNHAQRFDGAQRDIGKIADGRCD